MPELRIALRDHVLQGCRAARAKGAKAPKTFAQFVPRV
jgi:hypothetical protein